MIYYDSSALLKLIRSEPESDHFRQWYAQQQHISAVSSALVQVEVIRALPTKDDATKARARSIIAGLGLIPMAHDLLDEAADLTQPLRSLDAIHLASALRLRSNLHAFVAYDKKLLQAVELAGLSTASPGAS